jgi:hypothetical protein
LQITPLWPAEIVRAAGGAGVQSSQSLAARSSALPLLLLTLRNEASIKHRLKGESPARFCEPCGADGASRRPPYLARRAKQARQNKTARLCSRAVRLVLV